MKRRKRRGQPVERRLLFEIPDKIADIPEAAAAGDVRHIIIGGGEQFTGQGDTAQKDVLFGAVARPFPKRVGEIGGTEKGMARQLVHGQFLGEMSVDVPLRFQDRAGRGGRRQGETARILPVTEHHQPAEERGLADS